MDSSATSINIEPIPQHPVYTATVTGRLSEDWTLSVYDPWDRELPLPPRRGRIRRALAFAGAVMVVLYFAGLGLDAARWAAEVASW